MDKEVVEAIARANATYEAAKPRTAIVMIKGVAAIHSEARDILGDRFYGCTVARGILHEAKSLPRASIVGMRTIFEQDPAAREDMAAFLKQLGKGDDTAAVGRNAAVSAARPA